MINKSRLGRTSTQQHPVAAICKERLVENTGFNYTTIPMVMVLLLHHESIHGTCALCFCIPQFSHSWTAAARGAPLHDLTPWSSLTPRDFRITVLGGFDLPHHGDIGLFPISRDSVRRFCSFALSICTGLLLWPQHRILR
jgi:hypothetical protein